MFGDGRLPERFWNLVAPCPMSGCWLWLGSTRNGYGSFYMERRNHGAHRAAYLSLVGPINSESLDHLCRVRCCVNPAHLEPVSYKENNRRSSICLSTINKSKTHCKRGHLLEPGNLVRSKSKIAARWRECLICRRTQGRAYSMKTRASARAKRARARALGVGRP